MLNANNFTALLFNCFYALFGICSFKDLRSIQWVIFHLGWWFIPPWFQRKQVINVAEVTTDPSEERHTIPYQNFWNVCFSSRTISSIRAKCHWRPHNTNSAADCSPNKLWQTWNICGFLENCLWKTWLSVIHHNNHHPKIINSIRKHWYGNESLW